MLGRETLHHLTVEARRRGENSTTRTVVAERLVPARVRDLRFIMLELAKRIVDRYFVVIK